KEKFNSIEFKSWESPDPCTVGIFSHKICLEMKP
ncbi:hypothetical protein ISN45_Aa03g025290, partial [Arabidopsis thaliana x Arabidopsis arenosa]